MVAPTHPLQRKRLPNERAAFTHHFEIGAHEGYLHVGLYADGKPGEIFVKMSKQGSTVSGLMDAIALLTSLCLQYGVPLEVLVEKFKHGRFQPSGVTSYAPLSPCTSVLDYLFRYLELKFTPGVGDEDSAGHPIVDPIIPHAIETASDVLAPVA